MAGIDAQTGKVLGGWPHTVQSLGKLFTTAIGSRVMRRLVGSAVPALLGRSLTAPNVLRFKTAIIAAVELWEPRFRIAIVYDGTEADIEGLRAGRLRLLITGAYRPRGHLGDFTEEGDPKIVELGADGTLRPAS